MKMIDIWNGLKEVQIEYIQKQLEIIDENEKQRIIMEQREREKNGNN